MRHAAIGAIAIGAIGIGGVARADERRPFGQADLTARSSVGVSVTGGQTRFHPGFGRDYQADVGELVFDAAYVRGRGRLFASLPIRYLDNDLSGGGTKRGNVTVGGGFADHVRPGVILGIGVSLSFAPYDDAEEGILIRHDASSYARSGAVHVFTDGRVRTGPGYVQLELAYTGWRAASGESDSGDTGVVAAIGGGGVPIVPTLWVIGDAGVLQYVARGAGENESTMMVANLGLRGGVGFDPRGTWAVRGSFHTGDGYTTISAGLELRADLVR